MAATTRSNDLVPSLISAIRDHRDGAYAEKMARDLLELVTSEYRLIGIIDTAHRAVYYDRSREVVTVVPFDPVGVYRFKAQELAHISESGLHNAWARAQPIDWNWINPSFDSEASTQTMHRK